MKVLVSGAGGFLGRHAVDRLLARGHVVRAIIRPISRAPVWPDAVEIFRADLRTNDDFNSAFDGIDAVLHLAAATSGGEDIQFASTVVATERFLEAMVRSSVKRIVHVSSLVVYDWARTGKIMDEDTPLLNNLYEMGAYTIAKSWQERIVLRYAKAHSLNLSIMRPGFIWGEKQMQIAGMGRSIGRFHFMFGPLTRLPLCHVINCADCLVHALEKSTAVGEVFNVVDTDNIRVWRYVIEFLRRNDRVGVVVPIPYRVGLGVAYSAALTSRISFGRQGKLPSLLTPARFQSQFKPIRFSNRKVMQVLGWTPPFNFDQCLDLSFRKPT